MRLGATWCWRLLGGDSLKLSRHSRHSLGHFQYLDAPKDELPRSGSSRVVIIPTTTRSLDGTKPRPSESVPRRPGSDEVPANHVQLPQLLFIYMQKRLGYGAGILDPDLYKGPVPRFPPSCWDEMKARKKDGPRERLLQPRIGHELRYWHRYWHYHFPCVICSIRSVKLSLLCIPNLCKTYQIFRRNALIRLF